MAKPSDRPDSLESLEAITAFRSQLARAAESADPFEVAPLLTDDYVYYQPNFEGPSTYGRQAHLDYLRSLPRVRGIETTLFDTAIMGRWAFEAGEERYTETTYDGAQVEQTARFARLLHQNASGRWQLARTARGMALDRHGSRVPPRPEHISNGGRGHWQPMQIDIDGVSESRWFVAADRELMRQMICSENAGSLAMAASVRRSPSHCFASTTGTYTWAEYEQVQRALVGTLTIDDLQRHNEDARVIVPNAWAYSMGRGILVGVLDRHGEAVRYGSVHLFLHLWQRVDEGGDPWPWKVYSSFTCDMVNPFAAMDPDNPLRSDVAHRYLDEQRRLRVVPQRNKFEMLNATK